MQPSRPCAQCGSTRFALLPEFHVEMVCWKKLDGGNVLHPSFKGHICMGCRTTTFVALPGKDSLPESVQHVVVDIAQPSGR